MDVVRWLLTSRARRCWPALLLALGGTAAQAQSTSDVTPRSPAQSLSCLQRPGDPPRYSQINAQEDNRWLMRVQLRFDKPDARPKAEVLFNDGVPESLQDQVVRYIAQYRLPCLTPADGVVTAVQEFNFNNTERAPLPYETPGVTDAFCVVAPRRDLESPPLMSGKFQHVIVAMTFDGDGQQPPKVKVLYAEASSAVEDATVAQAKLYRMPCRAGSEAPRTVDLHYTFATVGTNAYTVPDEILKLGRFLGMTENVAALDADFDFHSMDCPFRVNYTTYSPHLPNQIRTAMSNPNRTAFLKWLSERNLHFANAKQANELFGKTFQIQVNCGALHLHPKTASAGG